MLALLGATGSYDHASREFTFDVTAASASSSISQQAGIQFDMGSLTKVTTEDLANLTSSGETALTVGFVMRPLGENSSGQPFTLVADVAAGTGTALSGLNRGAGVPLEAGLSDLQVELSDGTIFEVNLDGATNIGQVLQKLNAASPGSLAFESMLNEDADGLQLVDRTDGSGTFQVTPINESVAAISLSINDIGDAGDVEGEFVIVGGALHRDTLSDHFFIRDGSLSVSTTVDVPTITGPATGAPNPQFGFVDVDVTGGSANSSGAPMSLIVTLTDPGTQADDNRATLRELFEGTNDLGRLIGAADISGEISAAFQIRPDVATLNAVGISDLSPAQFSFDMDLASASPEMGSLDPSVNNAVYRLLKSHEHVTGGDITSALDQLSTYLHATESLQELGSALPPIDQPLGPSVGVGAEFDNEFEGLKAAQPNSLQSVLAQLPVGTSLTFDDSASPALRFDVDLSSMLVSQLPLNLDLTSLGVDLNSAGLQSVPRLVDSASMDPFSASTANLLDLIATVSLHADLGVDLLESDRSDIVSIRHNFRFLFVYVERRRSEF